jgi:hypothetical protein
VYPAPGRSTHITRPIGAFQFWLWHVKLTYLLYQLLSYNWWRYFAYPYHNRKLILKRNSYPAQRILEKNMPKKVYIPHTYDEQNINKKLSSRKAPSCNIRFWNPTSHQLGDLNWYYQQYNNIDKQNWCMGSSRYCLKLVQRNIINSARTESLTDRQWN